MAKIKTCCNFALIDKDKLAKKALTKSNNIITLISIVSKAYPPVSALASDLTGIYTKMNL